MSKDARRLKFEIEKLEQEKGELLQVISRIEEEVRLGQGDAVDMRRLKKRWSETDKKIRAIYKKIDDKKQQELFK